MRSNIARRGAACVLTPVTLACALAACGGDGTGITYGGKVVATSFAASTTGNPTLTPGYYSGATVFLDENGNGVLDSGEPSTTTDASGKFTLNVGATASGQIVADIPTTATPTPPPRRRSPRT